MLWTCEIQGVQHNDFYEKKTKIFNIKQESVLKIKPQGYDNQTLKNLALEVIEHEGLN